MRLRSGGPLLLAAGLAVSFWTGAARAADTVTGEVVDLTCYLAHPDSSKGAAHKACAETCVNKGLPMGLLTDDKQVYVLVENHDNPKPYAQLRDKVAQKVTLEGDKVTQGGTQGLIVESLK